MITKTVHTYGEVIEMTYLRQNVTTLLKDGKFTYLYNGTWIEQDVFEVLFPIPIYRKPNKAFGENPNSSQNYLNNVKSY